MASTRQAPLGASAGKAHRCRAVIKILVVCIRDRLPGWSCHSAATAARSFQFECRESSGRCGIGNCCGQEYPTKVWRARCNNSTKPPNHQTSRSFTRSRHTTTHPGVPAFLSILHNPMAATLRMRPWLLATPRSPFSPSVYATRGLLTNTEQTRRYATRMRVDPRMRGSMSQVKKGQSKQGATSTVFESLADNHHNIDDSMMAVLAPGTPRPLLGFVSLQTGHVHLINTVRLGE